VTWPDSTTTITRPGWKCQPEKPRGVYVIVCTWTSVGPLVWSLTRSSFTLTLSERVARWARIVDVNPEPVLANAIVAPDAAMTVIPARPTTSFRFSYAYSSGQDINEPIMGVYPTAASRSTTAYHRWRLVMAGLADRVQGTGLRPSPLAAPWVRSVDC